LKVLAYLRHYPPPWDGGAYYYNYHFFRTLAAMGFDVTILTHALAEANTDSPGVKIIPHEAVKTGRHVYKGALQKATDVVRAALAIRRQLDEGDFPLVFVDTGYIQELVVMLAGLGRANKSIGLNFAEEISVIQRTNRLRAFAQRRLLQRHCLNVVISGYTEGLLRSAGADRRTLLVYPSVMSNQVLVKSECRATLVSKFQLEPDTLLVGFLGRLIRRKGAVQLVRAVELLNGEGSSVSLLIAGDGPDGAGITELVRQSQASPRMRVVGRIPEDQKPLFLSGIDVFCMPNFEDSDAGSEGFGIVLLEAAQQGTPVIGGMSGGAAEAVSQDRNGFLVDGSDVTAIASAIKRYIRDEHLRAAHGAEGRRWAARFNWQEQMRPLAQVLREIADGEPAS
jgi:glycosyltransferase involved in cell wall biosynthesis